MNLSQVLRCYISSLFTHMYETFRYMCIGTSWKKSCSNNPHVHRYILKNSPSIHTHTFMCTVADGHDVYKVVTLELHNMQYSKFVDYF